MALCASSFLSPHRNLSSANQSDRDAMRNCRGLIDSLVSYVQTCVSADRPDDKVGNVGAMCWLFKIQHPFNMIAQA